MTFKTKWNDMNNKIPVTLQQILYLYLYLSLPYVYMDRVYCELCDAGVEGVVMSSGCQST